MINEQKSYKKDLPEFVVDYLVQPEKFSRMQELTKWLNENPENRKVFDECLDIWQSSLKARKVIDYDKNEAWRRLKINLKVSNRFSARHGLNGISNIQKLVASAALVIIILAISGIVIYRKYIKSQDAAIFSEYIVPFGSKSKLVLPEGSTVWLNAGSKLIYNRQFGIRNRDVYFEGEGYFDVRRTKTPFMVKTSNVIIKVFGTQFNVKAYPDEKIVETTVEKGMVQIYSSLRKETKTKKVILKANQQAIFRSEKLVAEMDKERLSDAGDKEYTRVGIEEGKEAKQKIKINNNIKPAIYTSWKDERWIIESEELQSLARKFERKYNVKFKFMDESIKKYIFSGILKDETLEQVLEVIKLTAPIKSKIKDNTVFLQEDIGRKTQLQSK